MMTGSRLPLARMARTAAMPSISGISMSMVSRSGASWASLVSASLPLGAVPTTSMPGSPDRTSLTSRRMTTESSTTSTRMRVTNRLPFPAVPGVGGVQEVYRQVAQRPESAAPPLGSALGGRRPARDHPGPQQDVEVLVGEQVGHGERLQDAAQRVPRPV